MEASQKRSVDAAAADEQQQQEPAAKKPRKESEDMEESDEEEEEENLFSTDAPPAPQQQQEQQEERHANLSKFVRRMLDPNRKPRGLIEPPQVIPLNDEFLQAFGKREKEFDSQVGRSSEFDQSIQDETADENAKIDASISQQALDKQQQDDQNSRKVKITNLKYSTSQDVLHIECLNFGKVQEVIMPMDETNTNFNIGRAYVVFETPEAAQACVDQQLGGHLDGRPIRVSLAGDPPKGGGGGGGRDEKRYWEKDIATRKDKNERTKNTNICPLCAKVDDHEMRQCPLNRVCFNCGVPGHVSRECPLPRGQPPRLVCTLCCGSGHTRFECQRSVSNVPGINDAICLVCHQKGHFMCTELKWFFGLDGVFCYNCGGKGHVGSQCRRPRLEDLNRNEAWTIKEVERGQEYKLADEREMQREEQGKKERERQRQRQEERDRQRNRYRDRDRARSAPPQRPPGGGDTYYDDFTGGSYYNQYNNNNNNNNEYRYNIDDNNNNNCNSNYNNNRNNNRGYRNNNRQTSGGRRRGYR